MKTVSDVNLWEFAICLRVIGFGEKEGRIGIGRLATNVIRVRVFQQRAPCRMSNVPDCKLQVAVESLETRRCSTSRMAVESIPDKRSGNESHIFMVDVLLSRVRVFFIFVCQMARPSSKILKPTKSFL
jgi:hypothetical protein